MIVVFTKKQIESEQTKNSEENKKDVEKVIMSSDEDEVLILHHVIISISWRRKFTTDDFSNEFLEIKRRLYLKYETDVK